MFNLKSGCIALDRGVGLSGRGSKLTKTSMSSVGLTDKKSPARWRAVSACVKKFT